MDETGAEREKRLRKLAQRGVVRLFNAIGAAQGAPVKAEEESRKRLRGEAGASEAGEPRELGPGESMGPGGKVTRRPNVLGARGKGEARKLNHPSNPEPDATAPNPHRRASPQFGHRGADFARPGSFLSLAAQSRTCPRRPSWTSSARERRRLRWSSRGRRWGVCGRLRGLVRSRL